MAAHWTRLSGWGTRPIEIERIPRTPVGFRLDLNTTNWVELSQLEGIGPTLGQRIIADRKQNGPGSHQHHLHTHRRGAATAFSTGARLKMSPVP